MIIPLKISTNEQPDGRSVIEPVSFYANKGDKGSNYRPE
jgi:hypothetical protein